MPKEDLNQNAKRNVVKTSKYTHLIQKGACKVEATTKGDTLHTVLGMKEFALKHANQTKNLANALLGKNLKQTVANNYGFMYSHFQYEADPALQQMRSPQCSWSQRFTGIDCKSYSIFASTLLINQGINHFIRRVKQPNFNPEYWSHVYVVIPIDQETLNLDKGYYTIDGTLHSNTETPYLEKHDTEMSGLKHVWLNGPAPAQPQNKNYANLQAKLDGFGVLLAFMLQKGASQQAINEIVRVVNVYLSEKILPIVKLQPNGVLVDRTLIPYNYTGLNGSEVETNFPDLNTTSSSNSSNSSGGNSDIFNSIADFFKDLDFGNLFSSIDCIGGTAFDDDILKDLIPKITNYFLSKINLYNQAIANKDWQNLHKIFIDLYAYKDLMIRTYLAKKDSKNWNSCSNSSFDFVRDFLINKIQNTLIEAVHAHVLKYFNEGSITNTFTFTQPANSGDMFDGVKLWGTAIPNTVTTEVHAYKTSVTPKADQIPAFIITPEIETALNSDVNTSNINFNSFLQTLAQTAPIIYDTVTGNTSNNTNNSNTNNGNNLPIDNQTQPKLAGFSIWQGILLGGLVLGSIALAKSEATNKKETNFKAKK